MPREAHDPADRHADPLPDPVADDPARPDGHAPMTSTLLIEIDGNAQSIAEAGNDNRRAIMQADRVVMVTPNGEGWLWKDKDSVANRFLPREEVARLRQDTERESRGLEIRWLRQAGSPGPFGGGWRWCFGVKRGEGTLVVELFVGALHVHRGFARMRR